MQRRTTLALAALVALLAGATYVVQRPHEAGMRRLDLVTLARGGIDRIEVQGNHNVVLRREGRGWVLGNGRAADAPAVQDALARLLRLNTSDFVTDDPARLADLGVDDAHGLQLRLLRDGTLQRALVLAPRPAEVGPREATGLVRDGAAVFAERFGLAAAFDRDEAGWEDRAVLGAHAADVVAVQVQLRGSPAYGLRRSDAQGAWTLDDAPATAAAADRAVWPRRFDPQQAQQLVDRLTQLRAAALVDADPGDAVTGLAPDAADVWRWRQAAPPADVTATAPANAEHTLHLGKARADGGVWARSDVRALPFVVDEATAAGLRRGVDSLANLALMAPMAFDELQEATLRPDARQEVTFVKSAAGWQLRRGRGLAKDFVLAPQALTMRLRQASLARAIGLVPAPAQASAKAKLAGGGRLVLRGANGARHALVVGQKTTYRGTPAYYAQGSADDQVYYVSKPLVDNLFGKLEALGQKAARASATSGLPQGLDSLPPEVQESIRKQLAGAAAQP